MKNKQILNVKSILGFRRSKSKKTEQDLVKDVQLKQKKSDEREKFRVSSFGKLNCRNRRQTNQSTVTSGYCGRITSGSFPIERKVAVKKKNK